MAYFMSDHANTQIPQQQQLRETTLDEPVHKTVVRDIRRIGVKLYHVLFPFVKEDKSLRDWDLWGPLVFCLMLALLLFNMAIPVFVIFWAGSFVVTINASLLHGKVSFFQGVCVLGYCVFPLCVAALLISFVHPLWKGDIVFRGVVTLAAFFWSTYASYGFLSGMIPPERRLLAVYPIFLFYLVLGWMVVAQYST